MATEIQIDGLEDLERQLLTMTGKDAHRIVRKGLREGGKIVVNVAKFNLATINDTGALSESIGIMARKGRGTNLQTVFVGERSRNKKAIALANAGGRKVKGVFWANLVERGTVRGQRAQPFLRPALDDNVGSVTRQFGKVVAEEIEKVLKKAARNVTRE